MRKLKFICLLSVFFVSLDVGSYAQSNGYVSLKGRQFYDENGKEFYPVVMNYNLNHVFNVSNYSETYVSPVAYYGYNDEYCDCIGAYNKSTKMTDCQLQFKNQLIRLKEFGFNTIRICGISPRYLHDGYLTYNYYKNGGSNKQEYVYNSENQSGSPINHYTGYAYRNISSNQPGQPWSENYIKLEQIDINGVLSFKNDAKTSNYLDKVKSMLDICESVNMKVIYGASGAWFNDKAVDEFTDMLLTMAEKFKESKSLLAYDLYNEPELDWEQNKNLENEKSLTKQQVCEFTTEWYDAIKSVDTNHLITIGAGNVSAGTLAFWDPAFIKVDFISPHVYPYPNNYENRGGRYSRIDLYERWRAEIYWQSKYSPLPWLIGETSLPALDDITGSTCTSNCSDYTVPPYTWGSEEEQRQFSQNILRDVWDYGGSGISWWEFQTSLTTSAYRDTGQLRPDGNRYQAYWAYWPLFYSKTDPAEPKPGAYEFQNFDITQRKNPPPTQLSNAPAGYFDPGHTLYYSNEYKDPKYSFPYTPGVTISGRIIDQNSNPIEGAFVVGRTVNNIYDLSTTDETWFEWDEVLGATTFTDENGEYHLTPFNPFSLDKPNSNQFFWRVSATALGASRTDGEDGGNVGNPWLEGPQKPIQVPVNNVDFTLHRIDLKLEDTFISQPAVTTQIDKGAREKLTLAHDVIEASATKADFHALNEVNIKNEFWAKEGSEAHFYLEPFYTDCSSDFTEPTGVFRYGKPEVETVSLKYSEIELEFQSSKTVSSITLFPNPSSGLVKIEYTGNKNDIKNIEIYDMLGKLVYTNTFNSDYFNMELSSLPKGVYTFRLKDREQTHHKKLILQ